MRKWRVHGYRMFIRLVKYVVTLVCHFLQYFAPDVASDERLSAGTKCLLVRRIGTTPYLPWQVNNFSCREELGMGSKYKVCDRRSRMTS